MTFKVVKCSDIIDVRDGTHDSPKYVDKGYPLVTSKNIKNNKIDFENINYISYEDFENINKRSAVDNGDILMPMIGTVGNPVLVNTEVEFAIKNVALFKVSENDLIDKKYFYYLLKSNYITRQLEQHKRGGTQSFVSLKNLRELKIPLPSLEEQEKIVYILEKSESAKQKREESLMILDELVKSRFIEMFGNISKNDKNFDKVILKNIVDVGSSKRIYANEYIESGIPFYRSKEIRELGSNLKPSIELFISNEKYEVIKHKFGVPKRGDILIAAIGATIGFTWIVNTDEPFYYKDGNLVHISINQSINSIYLNHALKILIDEFKIRGAAGTAQLALSIEKLGNMEIVYPNIELQNQFADFVNQVDKLKFEMEESLKELENNFDSLMQKAFKGELL